jgi:hypothetical protein
MPSVGRLSLQRFDDFAEPNDRVAAVASSHHASEDDIRGHPWLADQIPRDARDTGPIVPRCLAVVAVEMDPVEIFTPLNRASVRRDFARKQVDRTYLDRPPEERKRGRLDGSKRRPRAYLTGRFCAETSAVERVVWASGADSESEECRDDRVWTVLFLGALHLDA